LNRDTHKWDKRNAPARAKLKANKVDIQDRMFNNHHIGHNKFTVYLDKHGTAQAVMTGSTNWTSLGLCGQTNNSIIIENSELAEGYRVYWQRLHDDEIEDPDPPSAPGGTNVQGKELREQDQTSVPVTLNKSKATIWYFSEHDCQNQKHKESAT
jgi:phosphatidylserine/phosphatidylglycerophosphate/cardiolipin synthase-like enzyme